MRSMYGRTQSRIEIALLAGIALVSVVLSYLQYRWTGELSLAEPALLRAGLNNQVRRLAQAFDNEIRENIASLLPDGSEIEELGDREAHRVRYADWTAAHDRAFFGRIGVAAVGHETITLYQLDDRGLIQRIQWPEEWQSLRESMEARVRGSGRPPNGQPGSNAIEAPVFSTAGGPEIEWMIFDINEDYARRKTLPRLVTEYLNPGPDPVYDVSVSPMGGDGPVIFSTHGTTNVAAGADATTGIFPIQAGGGGRGRFRDATRWILSVRHREGSLDIAVARVRTRNLFVSLALIGLLGGVAWALVRFTARSRQLADMQFRFAAGVSHDLRTPLTAIRGAAFNLSNGLIKDSAAVGRYAKLILRNAEELTSMIENVLAFSATLHQTHELPHTRLDVGELVERAASSMTTELEQADCRIEVAIAPDLPPIEGDGAAIELALRNLISNAIRHGASGRWIGMSATRTSDAVEIRVSDHGPGIPESERARIFDAFYRGGQTRVQRIQGTGLGLSLVKSAIERHHGSVRVTDAEGGGAQFIVRLPAAPAGRDTEVEVA